MQVEDPDRQSESARPIDTVRESNNGAATELHTAAQELSNQDVSLGEDSVQMTRSSSEASTSSVLSSDDEKLLDKVAAPEKRVSYYVQVFEEMLDTVLQFESHLFNQEELEMLARFKSMSYPARYLFVRLFSRKNGWFRVAKLGYHDELVDVQAAVDEICNTVAPPAHPSQSTDIERTVPEAGPSGTSSEAAPLNTVTAKPVIKSNGISKKDPNAKATSQSKLLKGKMKAASVDVGNVKDPLSKRPIKEVKQEIRDFGLTRFAINEFVLRERNDTDELLDMLSLDELKVLGKQLRIPANFTSRAQILEAIKKTAANQSTLTSMFAAAAWKKKEKTDTKSGAVAVETGKTSQTAITLPSAFEPTRQTEVLTNKALQHVGRCIKLESGPIRVFARLHLLYYRSISYSEKTLTQAVLARFKIRNYPSYTVKRSITVFEDRQALVDYEEALLLERKIEELTGEAVDSTSANRFRRLTKEGREEDMREALAIFEDVYPRWKEMVRLAKLKDEEEEKERKAKGIADDKLTYYRKRFLAGWPLTRVVYKGATILAKLHEYDREVEVMKTLLEQSCFRRGKRGEWYDRLALLYMHHHSRLDQSGEMDKEKYQRKALEICYEGLRHPWTHVIYHNSLARRIVRLETALGVPKAEKHPPVPGLKKALFRCMYGEKMSEGETGKKSKWRAQDGSEVSVERLCLEQFEREGWRGFHSENGILTTIFALLFWDVIFAPIDGVFETAYQAGPLDLSTDAFAIVRADLVAERLQDIENGRALHLLLETDERERENKTYCVGMRWGYEREDLVEIIQCFDPLALVTICRVYAEEWSHRMGGVPDLFLWNFSERRCRFVEVKGPGDYLSETQKMWIDVLITAGVSVERCVVQEIFEESYMSLSDGPSPRKSKVSPSRKRKGSQEEEKHGSRDEDEPTGPVRTRPASAKVPAPKPSPPAQPERASPKKEKSPSHIAQSTSAVKAKKRRVSEAPEEVRKKKNEARPSLTKERRKSSGEGSKKKPKKRPSLSANTSGTTIVLSD